MEPAQIAKKAFLAISISVAALVFPLNAWAASGNTQICRPNTSCTIGEFLYDDSYTKITDATCTITSRYPNGSLFLDAASLTSSAELDGWYSNTFNTPQATGLYRTEIRCVTSGETVALDKTFEVKSDSSLTSADVSSAVWNATRSSYTTPDTFGEALQNVVPLSTDIANSVWGYSNRTISNFGTLVADIWASATRTLTGAGLTNGSLATQSEVNNVKNEVVNAKNDIMGVKSEISPIKDTVNNINSKLSNNQSISIETRNLVDKLVNKPIIEKGLEFDNAKVTLDLENKLSKSASVANQLLLNSNYIKSKLNLVRSKWDRLNSAEIITSINSLSLLTGSENDGLGKNTIFGQINWVRNEWSLPVATNLYSQNKKIDQQLKLISQNLAGGNKTKSALLAKQTLASIDVFINLVGSKNYTSKDTLFGQIREKGELSSALNKNYGDVNVLLANWNYNSKSSYKKPDEKILDKIINLSKKIASLNQLPRIGSILAVNHSNNLTQKELRNKTLGLRGVIEANKQLLAMGSNKPFGSLWLEEGSIVFKTLITNPSSKNSQKVSLNFSLPREVAKESIIKIDNGLSVDYDEDKGQYTVTGEFTLAANESRTYSVIVDDIIFQINQSDIESIQKQAEELVKPLKNTSYFAQGVILQSDIEASLKKVESLQKEGITPEAKIKAYRDSQIEYSSAKDKLEKLKELATNAGSVGTMFGFVGGAQVLAVWGLIIIFVAGFVFLALYMKAIRGGENPTTTRIKKPLSLMDEETGKYYSTSKSTSGVFEGKKRLSKHVVFTAIILTTALISLSAIYAIFNIKQNLDSKNSKDVKQTTEVVLEESSEDTKESGIEINIFVPSDSTVGVFDQPSLTSRVLTNLDTSIKAKEIKKAENWVKISFKNNEDVLIKGWVDKDFVEYKKQGNASQEKKEVKKTFATIDPTITFLRVRKSPDGQEVTQVFPGEEYPIIKSVNNWVQIVLEDGTMGWVSADFVK